MKVKFSINLNGETIEEVVEILGNPSDKCIDSLLAEWAMEVTNAEWEEVDE